MLDTEVERLLRRSSISSSLSIIIIIIIIIIITLFKCLMYLAV